MGAALEDSNNKPHCKNYENIWLHVKSQSKVLLLQIHLYIQGAHLKPIMSNCALRFLDELQFFIVSQLK